MEIIKGSLDDISRPASSEQIGSRVTSVSLPHNDRITPTSPFSLVVLTNDDADIKAKSSSEENDTDSKLQRAIVEMRRLDEILSAEILNEKGIKRRRLELKANLWQELEENKPKSYSERDAEAVNTRLFLALEAPSNEPEAEDDFLSMFQTQCLYLENDRNMEQIGKRRRNSSPEPFEVGQEGTEQQQSEGSGKEKQKDFVRRNIKLTSGERGEVLMTQRQKERLAELLREIDQEEEDGSRGADSEQDKWAASVPRGHGYTPEPSEMQQLIEIDSKIRLLFPAEELPSLQSSYTNLSMSQGRGSEVGWNCEGDLQPGEKVLQDMKEWRGQERRLHEIQQQLEMLEQGQEMTDESPELTEEQLRSLLNQCELTQSWRIEDMDTSSRTP
ncbi:fibrous sheath-interacting protein 1 [Genypterus blacodes]|uniref:fibrous sheath-interacting protein 1 n=1 Tax=Genypterus blacodes TaxID=154954 RepID=UPI003F774533